MNIYRHGDLSFHPIEKLPEGLKEEKHKGSFVLAEGEFTGHKHVISTPDITKMKVMRDSKGGLYIDLREEAELVHQEHKPLKFKPGLYKMNVEREFDYFAEESKRIRSVID